MNSLQSKGRNSHIFRFQREYVVILRTSTVCLPLCHRLAKAYSPLRNRRNSEGRTKAERRMNEQLSKEYRRTIEHQSKERRLSSYLSITKLQNNHEICKQKHYYFIHLSAFALSCLKLRRNDIVSPPTPFSQFNVSLQVFINRTLSIF